MSAERTPPDPADAAARAFFFPEAADEAGGIDHETVLIIERRVKVMTHYRRGLAMRAIAAAVGCSAGTVHADIHAVLDGYKRLAAKAVEDHRADALQRLAHREAELEADLARSRGEAVESSATLRTTPGEPQDTSAVKRRTTYGDYRLHALLLQCWDRRARLLGLLGRDDLRSAATAVKLVAGIDPSELV